MDSFDIYVPADGAALGIDPASAIVGSPASQWLEVQAARIEQRESQEVKPSDELVLDFEGNRFGAVNIITFADRCVHAAGRHREHYPTVARIVVPAAKVIRVGSFDLAREEVELDVERGREFVDWLDFDGDYPQLLVELRGTSIRAARA